MGTPRRTLKRRDQLSVEGRPGQEHEHKREGEDRGGRDAPPGAPSSPGRTCRCSRSPISLGMVFAKHVLSGRRSPGSNSTPPGAADPLIWALYRRLYLMVNSGGGPSRFSTVVEGREGTMAPSLFLT